MRSRGLGATALVVGLGVASAATAGAESLSAPAGKRVRLADQWAGIVDGTDAYISVFTLNNDDAGAYLADGAEVATLVLGERDGDTIELNPTEGTTVTATVEGDEVSGTVTLNGADYDFTAEESTGDGGWYRGVKETSDSTIAAGFIVLEDGSYRGAIREGDEVVATPDFDPDDLTLDLPGGGTIKVLPVAKFVKKEQTLDPSSPDDDSAAELAADVPSPYQEPPQQADATYVTENIDADTWFAVVVSGGDAIGYFCDGASAWGTVAGAVDDDGNIELEGLGATFSGTAAADTVTGTLTVDGNDFDLTLAPAAPGTTGLYRLAELDTVTWWIQTSAGLKGAIQSTKGGLGQALATSDASDFTFIGNGGAGGNGITGAGEAP